MQKLLRTLAFLCFFLLFVPLAGQAADVAAQLVKSEHPRKGETGTLRSDRSDLQFILRNVTLIKIHNSDVTQIRCWEKKEWFRTWKLLFPPALLAPQVLHYVAVEYSDSEGARQSSVFVFDEAVFGEAQKIIEESTGKKVG